MKIIPQELFNSLVQQFIKDKKQLEECIIHLDLKHLNFDEIISLCEKHKMYKAYIYAFNSVHGKYIEPLNKLIELLNEDQVSLIVIEYLEKCFQDKMEDVKKEMIQFLFFRGITWKLYL